MVHWFLDERRLEPSLACDRRSDCHQLIDTHLQFSVSKGTSLTCSLVAFDLNSKRTM